VRVVDGSAGGILFHAAAGEPFAARMRAACFTHDSACAARSRCVRQPRAAQPRAQNGSKMSRPADGRTCLMSLHAMLSILQTLLHVCSMPDDTIDVLYTEFMNLPSASTRRRTRASDRVRSAKTSRMQKRREAARRPHGKSRGRGSSKRGVDRVTSASAFRAVLRSSGRRRGSTVQSSRSQCAARQSVR